MKSNKARRLSLRVPVTGWEAYVSTNSSKNTRAKIANVSADGAYLITRERYQPASTVALSIKSPAISFSVTGLVVRNDPYGVAIRFLDHNETTRNSLLRIISTVLAEKMPKPSGLKEAPLRRKSLSKLNGDSEQECFQASAVLSTAPPSKVQRLAGGRNRLRSPEQECFYTTALISTEPCSEAPPLAEISCNSAKDNSFTLSSAHTHSAESLKVFLSHCGTTTVKCPLCEKRHYTTVPEQFHNKPVRAKCECGKSFSILFDSRKYFRKDVRLPGEYWDTSGMQDLMTVTTLSICGAGFEARRKNLLVQQGETIQMKFLLNNIRNWIRVKAVVKRVKGNQIGVEFTELNDHQRKCIGFYLMP